MIPLLTGQTQTSLEHTFKAFYNLSPTSLARLLSTNTSAHPHMIHSGHTGQFTVAALCFMPFPHNVPSVQKSHLLCSSPENFCSSFKHNSNATFFMNSSFTSLQVKPITLAALFSSALPILDHSSPFILRRVSYLPDSQGRL